MFVRRTLSESLSRLEKAFPVVLVTGARQVGKSTLLKEHHPDIRYVTLDDPDLRLLANQDPKLFVQRFPSPLIIDEVQYAPELFSVLKLVVDADRRSGMYWLSGSQQFHLMKNISDSLAGRLGILHLAGLSTRELANDSTALPFRPPGPDKPAAPMTSRALFERIWRGSYPELYVNPNLHPDDFYRAYVATYLQRDVRDLAQVGDSNAFMVFMRLVAGRTGQLLNVSQLANEADLTSAKVQAWLAILEASGLVIRLMPYHANQGKRLVKVPKLYFTDTGLAAWLAQWPSPETLMTGAAAGAFLETYAVMEIWKSYIHHGLEPPLWFYRDFDQKEVDILLVQDGTAYPMDVKNAASVDRRLAKRLQVAEALGLRQGPGLVLSSTDQRLPLSGSVDSYPLGWL
ncbi:MAG: ATP-binding protein [Bradyrhizobium sp.]|uniref:ATP-binding protein n=1 Tax=Bradyrhizobium sp. TaxID=376 RepID=UPI003D11B4D3